MLLKQNLSIFLILKITWKADILMLVICSSAYLIDTRVLPSVHLVPTLPALLGTAIAFFIGFNNNHAYSRWWEARAVWGGLTNDSRSWARELIAYSGHPELARKMILRQLGFLYALKSRLRKETDEEFGKYITPEDMRKIDGSANIPASILNLQSESLQQLSDHGMDGFRFLALNELIRDLAGGMGKSEKISGTVFPTSYDYFTRMFIWILIVLTTMTISENVGIWSIFFGWIIGFVFYSSHLTGMSLINPFEARPSGIPLNSLTRTIEINLLQMLGEQNIPPPVQPLHHGEYIL